MEDLEVKKYYSYDGQDKWVIEKIFKYKKNGFFLELGAAGGIFISNTYALEKHYGWKGICIEANKKLFNKLKNNRKCFCDNSCVDGKNHKVKFVDDGTLSGGIADVHSNYYKEDDCVIKDTVTLAEILKRYDAPKIIDYFSFDVEGAETRILKDFPFDEYIFSSMSIEGPSKLLHSILEKNMYVGVGSNKYDILYLHKSVFKDISISAFSNNKLFWDKE
jgi:FkbM family methyltransferase